MLRVDKVINHGIDNGIDHGKVIGHEEVKEALRQLSSHTLLFTGPERVGRRTVARWYAQWLNCGAGGAEPCGGCASCLAMASGNHPDYREVGPDVSTKTGRVSRRPQIRIDELVPREGGNPEPLSRWLETRPRTKWRVGVIDQAESMGEQAANAFLKLLEEPPSYVRIILIAPSAQAVLPTIASRSTILRFGALRFESDHPLARLGRLGDLKQAEADKARFEDALGVIDTYLLNLPKDLQEAFLSADALEKLWSNEAAFDIAELLRARLSSWPPQAYAGALAAVEACEKALEAYASAPLALQVLTLELREILGRD